MTTRDSNIPAHRQISPAPAGQRDFPLKITRAGVIYLAACAFIAIAAVNSQVNLLYFVFGMSVGGMLISILLARVSLHGLEIRREFGEHIVAGEPTEVQYRLVNTKRIWPSMALRFREIHPDLIETPQAFVLYLPAAARSAPGGTRVTTRLVARRRGAIRLSTMEITSTFPFGFLRMTRRLQFPQELIVYPRIGMLNRHLALHYRESIETGTMTSNRRGGNDEFYGVREYRPGDNIRAIHWRSTARTGELMIRELAANAPPQLIIVLNLRTWRAPAADGIDLVKARQGLGNPEQRENVERAIELAAALVCYGFYENFAVGLAIAGLPGQLPPTPKMGRETRAAHLRQLATLDPRQLTGAPVEIPNRLAGRAEWIIVTLHADDPVHDLLPPSASSLVGAAGRSFSGGGMAHRTMLSMDAPDSAEWVHFLSTQEALRLLREHTA